MTFGKRGRPPDDRLARQREIYLAVVPLIEKVGARQLSMRQAADMASLSIGGLYHYFPTKRELVLHGLQPEAIMRVCQDFHDTHGYLAATDTRRYIEEGIELILAQVRLCRPAISAALELGTESFWEVVETLLNGTQQAFEMNLQLLSPTTSQEEVGQWGRAIRRTICAALLDKRITPDELRNELRILIEGYAQPVENLAAL